MQCPIERAPNTMAFDNSVMVTLRKHLTAPVDVTIVIQNYIQTHTMDCEIIILKLVVALLLLIWGMIPLFITYFITIFLYIYEVNHVYLQELQISCIYLPVICA